MVRAWYMDSSPADQRMPHRLEGASDVSLQDLAKLGVHYWRLDADHHELEGKLAAIREERGYSYSDILTCSPDKLPNYEQKLKMFFEEHIHTDEEIRFVLDGSGYFDVRDTSDRWIRIEVEKNDLVALPAGLYHRFTLDSKNYFKAMRLFRGDPVWTAHPCPQDKHPVREQYVKNYCTCHEM